MLGPQMVKIPQCLMIMEILEAENRNNPPPQSFGTFGILAPTSDAMDQASSLTEQAPECQSCMSYLGCIQFLDFGWYFHSILWIHHTLV